MSNRQYIGARYVPKLANPLQWDIDTPYEALTIVTNNGNSFTSRKPVPVGIQLSNSEYWCETWNYSAQFAGLESSIDQLGIEIANVESSVSDMGTDNKPIGMKNVIIVSDSYGVVPNVKFQDVLRAKLGVNAANWFVTAVGGAGFVEAVNSFDVNLTTLLGTMTDTEKNNVTHILVVAGTNDMIYGTKTAAQILEGIGNFMTVVENNLPFAKVHIFPVGTCLASARLLNFANGVAAYSQCYKYDRCFFHNGVQFALKDKSLLAEDLTHPNNYGSQRIADTVYNALMIGYCHCGIPKFTINGTSPRNDPFTVDCIFNEGMWEIRHTSLQTIRPEENETWSLTTGSGQPVASIPSDYFVGTSECEVISNIYLVQTGVTGITKVEAIVRLSGNSVVIVPQDYDLELGTTKTWEDITQIRIPEFSITCTGYQA